MTGPDQSPVTVPGPEATTTKGTSPDQSPDHDPSPGPDPGTKTHRKREKQITSMLFQYFTHFTTDTSHHYSFSS